MPTCILKYDLPVVNYDLWRMHLRSLPPQLRIVLELDSTGNLQRLAFGSAAEGSDSAVAWSCAEEFLLAVHPTAQRLMPAGNSLLLRYQLCQRVQQGRLYLHVDGKYRAPKFPPVNGMALMREQTLSSVLNRLFPRGLLLVMMEKGAPVVFFIRSIRAWHDRFPDLLQQLQNALQRIQKTLPYYLGICSGIVRYTQNRQVIFEEAPPPGQVAPVILHSPNHLFYVCSYPDPIRNIDPVELLLELMTIYGGTEARLRQRVGAALLLACLHRLLFVNADSTAAQVDFPILIVQHQASHQVSRLQFGRLLGNLSLPISKGHGSLVHGRRWYPLCYRDPLNDHRLKLRIVSCYLRGQRAIIYEPPDGHRLNSRYLNNLFYLTQAMIFSHPTHLRIFQPLFIFSGYNLRPASSLSLLSMTVTLPSLSPYEPVSFLGAPAPRHHVIDLLAQDRLLVNKIASSLLCLLREYCGPRPMSFPSHRYTDSFLPLRMVNSVMHMLGYSPLYVDYEMRSF